MTQARDFSSQLPTLLSTLRPLAERFADRGVELYLVGGIVRDLLLGLPSHDVDLTTAARPGVILELIEDLADVVWRQGEKFGTIGARISGLDVEVTTFRQEIYVPDSRKPQVTFGDDLAVDLSRRDFTINAMALDALTGVVVDPFDGETHLRDRLLRTPLDPRISFSDDPLRVLRAARFADRFELTMDPEVETAASDYADRMAIVSRERIRDEFEKLFTLPSVERGLGFLVRTGILAAVIPTASEAGVALAARIVVDNQSVPWWTRLAALIAPGSKPWGGSVSAASVARGLRCSAETTRAIEQTLRGSAMAIELDARATISDATISDAAVRRWVAVVAPWERASLALAAAELGREPSLARAHAEVAQREDVRDLSVPIDGQRIMELTGVTPGPKVGEVVAALREERIERGVLTATDAERFVRDRFGLGGA